jgi:hypothetical protein
MIVFELIAMLCKDAIGIAMQSPDPLLGTGDLKLIRYHREQPLVLYRNDLQRGFYNALDSGLFARQTRHGRSNPLAVPISVHQYLR